jgi:tripartite-type tricarboxylate transporter receptor subunit TctC
MLFRTFVAALAAVPLIALVQSFPALAQAWPSKPIRLVVPYPPGGSTDLLARTIGQKVGESLGQTIVIDNRAGAGGMLGSDMVARSSPDGYTILLGTGATHGLTLLLSKTVPYDPVRDFTAITAAVEVPIILCVHPSIPGTTATDLVDWAKKNPGKLAYGSSGTGSPQHLSGELFKHVTGIDMVHVPYKGAAPAVQDLIGGQIPAVFTTLSTALPHIRGGKIRVVGFVEARRQPSVPEIPTIGESIPGYAMPASWLGFFGPADLPEAILKRTNAEIVKAVQSPEVRAKLEAAGMPVVGTSPEEFARMVREDIETFRKIVAAAGIKPE